MALHVNFGKRIEDYEVLKQLGKGGFASVYEARCKCTDQLVAIKMINKKLIENAGLRKRVYEEVSIHSRLQHPSVLQLYEWFEDAQHVYLILELADNGELHRYMKEQLRRPFNEREAADILRQVVEGLLYLHSHRIMHRDISLSNLLLSRDMHVKIADFGLATQLQRVDERHMTMCGTPNYISPEVVSRASHGLPADVWGVGCMLYTLLVGRPPFDTDAVQSTLAKVVMCDYHPPPSELSWQARDLIERLLQKNPAQRIKLDDVLRHAFMQRSGGSSAATTAASIQSCSSSAGDSGIITFASSNSSSSRPPQLQRSRSVDKFAQPLAQIYEHQVDVYSNVAKQQQSQPQQNYKYNSLNDFREKHAAVSSTADSMEIEWYPHASPAYATSTPSLNAFPLASSQLTPSTPSNPYFHAKENEENHFLPSKKTFATPSSYNYHSQQEQQQEQQHMHMLAATPAAPPAPPVKTERISVPPLNTARLQPTRYKTKNAIMSILSGGEVAVEFIKYKSKLLADRITDICWISHDGARIIIYQPDPGRGLPIRETPPELPTTSADCIFTYDNLPTKHWRKYVYAARFVNLVKGKTPKVTYFSAQAKCHLMESMEDFEVVFYNGAKVTRSPSDGIKVYDQHGRQLLADQHHLHDVNDDDKLHAQMLRAHQDECFRHCLAICSALELVQTSSAGSCFPAVVGRRPVTELRAQCISTATTTRENISAAAYSTPKSQQGSFHFSISAISSLRNGSSASALSSVGQHAPPHSQTLAAQQNVPIKRINIPGIGTATELSHGIVQVQFLDGSLIAIIPTTQGGGLTYTQSSGVSTYFAPHDDLPLVVREKLNQLPRIEQELKTAPPLSNLRNGRNGAYDYMAQTTTTPKTAVVVHNQHPMKFFR